MKFHQISDKLFPLISMNTIQYNTNGNTGVFIDMQITD